MKLCGLQKTTLLDFPGMVAATVFTGGCSFRCPFCHNSELLGSEARESLTTEALLGFLDRRKNILGGVCITGGEPTLQPDLEELILDIRAIGLAVKLDTNGYRPDILEDLCKKGLLDFVAMDIKGGKSNYANAAGIPSLNIDPIEESIHFLLKGSVPYEFRTTVVRGIHTAQDFMEIGPWIAGCPAYYLQRFTESGQVLRPNTFSDFTKPEMEEFADLIRPYVKTVALRGID